MGLSHFVYGLIDLEDEELKKMLSAKKKMLEVSITTSSQEFIDKFTNLTGCHPDDFEDIDQLIQEIRTVEIEVTQGSGDLSEYWEVDVGSIPEKVKHIRFEVSC